MVRLFHWFAIGLLLVPANAEGGIIPDSLRTTDGPPNRQPFWVSEELALSANDSASFDAAKQHFEEAHWGYLSDAVGRFPGISDSPTGTLDDCEPYISMSFHHSTETAMELRRRAHYIARVRLVGTKPGFSHGRPGELVDLEVSSVLKNQSGVTFDAGFYLFHQYARMVIDGRAVCIGEPLPTGDFLVFLADESPWSELPVYELESNALISLSTEPSIHGYLFTPRNPEKELSLLLGGFER